MSFQEVLDAAKLLPTADRRRLVDSLQATLHSPQGVSALTTPQLNEIKRRVAAHAADPTTAIPWSELEKQIEKRLQELGE